MSQLDNYSSIKVCTALMMALKPIITNVPAELVALITTRNASALGNVLLDIVTRVPDIGIAFCDYLGIKDVDEDAAFLLFCEAFENVISEKNEVFAAVKKNIQRIINLTSS